MSESDKHLTVAECRALLAAEAAGMSDTDIERLRDRLEAVALAMLPHVRTITREDVERLRWAAHTHRHGLDREDLIEDPDLDDEDTAEDDPCPVQ